MDSRAVVSFIRGHKGRPLQGPIRTTGQRTHSRFTIALPREIHRSRGGREPRGRQTLVNHTAASALWASPTLSRSADLFFLALHLAWLYPVCDPLRMFVCTLHRLLYMQRHCSHRSGDPRLHLFGVAVQLSNPRSTPVSGVWSLDGRMNSKGTRLPHGGTMNRRCLPLPATSSSALMSSSVSLFRASSAPDRLASIRSGVTDLGKTTMSFLTAPRVSYVRWRKGLATYEAIPKERRKSSGHGSPRFPLAPRRSGEATPWNRAGSTLPPQFLST